MQEADNPPRHPQSDEIVVADSAVVVTDSVVVVARPDADTLFLLLYLHLSPAPTLPLLRSVFKLRG